MPINYARRLTDRRRSTRSNRQLGLCLAFVAGAANAGGFLAVQQYTSHMTGIVSAMADNLALGATDLALAGFGALLSFVLGAMCSTLMINFSRRRRLHSQYALPLALEAVLLLLFGILGAQLMSVPGFFVPLTVVLLCFIMGLQNAIITKLSNAEVRTTHITGMVTDIGIELGRLIYFNRNRDGELPPVRANRERLRIKCVTGRQLLHRRPERRTGLQALRLSLHRTAGRSAADSGVGADGRRLAARLAPLASAALNHRPSESALTAAAPVGSVTSLKNVRFFTLTAAFFASKFSFPNNSEPTQRSE